MRKKKNCPEENCQYKTYKVKKTKNKKICPQLLTQIKCLQIVKHLKYICIIPTGIELQNMKLYLLTVYFVPYFF